MSFLKIIFPSSHAGQTEYFYLLSKFDSALSVLRNVTLQRLVPEGHIYPARMNISQATMSVLQGPWAPGLRAQDQQNTSA